MDRRDALKKLGMGGATVVGAAGADDVTAG
ncbi:MAG: twin-arginine translocation signal domain-containing protein [Ilumatobacteraceae bacterium]|nr:twin-arginine translocation signal domain-containing protein [Ilumatobacteraceae bacterium]